MEENYLFEQESIHKAYFKLALPVVFSMVVSLIYNMVDTYFIARTQDTALIAGVSIGAPVFTLMIALGDIFGLGGSSAISRLFGQKCYEEGKRISAFCFYAAIALGLSCSAILLLFHKPILYLLGADAQTFAHAKDYFTVIALGAPVIILTLVPSNILRAEGLIKASMTGSILGAVINMILDPLFILYLGMGARGAAIATVIGNLGTDIYFIFILLTKSRRLSLSPSLLHITALQFRDILAIGIPAAITNLMQSLSIALTNRFLLPYGNDKIAAMGIVMKINMITALVLVGFAFGAQPLIGYNYGARNRDRLRGTLRFCYLFEVTLALIMSLAMCLTAPGLVSLFVTDADIITNGALMLRLQQISMVCIAVVLVSTCTFQSAGKAAPAFWLSINRQGILFAVILLAASYFLGYHGILATQAIADFLTALLAASFMRGLWKQELSRKE